MASTPLITGAAKQGWLFITNEEFAVMKSQGDA
jgi:hypothetical protein